MLSRRTIVLDIGKTNLKATLWDVEGRCLARESSPTQSAFVDGYRALDVAGIERWLETTLRLFSRQGTIDAIVPVTHGAAAALVADNELFAAPMDYEEVFSAEEREQYELQRDSFERTGSPALPLGLNLGMQLYHLERSAGPWPESVKVLLWPQYWAWRLSGVMASEVSSLGCHSDLWWPIEGQFSHLAKRRWQRHFPPVQPAATPLGVLTPDWVRRTGLAKTCRVYCGMHDSNAALVAARAHPGFDDGDLTVLSTGTWFVAMRSVARDSVVQANSLAKGRDCLLNTDVLGRPVPSSRFMGGREAEILAGTESLGSDAAECISRVAGLVARNVCVFPSHVAGVGPYPHAPGEWQNKPSDERDISAAVQLYLALMADASLRLIGSEGNILVEGRFAQDSVFTRALATLRKEQSVHICNFADGVAYGALRLVNPMTPPPGGLRRIPALDVDLTEYAEQWQLAAARRVDRAA